MNIESATLKTDGAPEQRDGHPAVFTFGNDHYGRREMWRLTYTVDY